MRNGYLLTIDEVFKIPAEIQMNFQTVYEEGGSLLLDEKPGLLCDKLVNPHPDFRLMSTDNARGTGDNFEKFGATQVQDSSTLDRFSLTVHVPYLNPDREIAILERMFPDLERSSLDNIVRFAGLVREAYGQSNLSLTLSMRGLKVAARLLMHRLSEQLAIRSVYVSKLSDDNEIATVEGFITTAGLSNHVGEAIKPKPEPKVAETPPWEEPKKEEENVQVVESVSVPWE